MCECVCVCVCVSNTTKLQKDYIFKMSFFLWLETGGFSETGKSLIVNVYECLQGPLMLCYQTSVESHWRECVAAAEKLCEKRGRVFENDVFIENTRLEEAPNAGQKFTCGHSFKQVTWFSWPMVSRDWICARLLSSLWEQVAYRPN